MFQIIVTDSFNNPNLPISQIGSILNLPNSLATYELMDGYDYSKNGHNLILKDGITFDKYGMVCTGVGGQYADTGLLETDSYSVLVAFNANTPLSTSQLWTSLPTGAAPYSGARQAILTSGALNSQAFAGDGTFSAIAGQTSGPISGSWEIWVFTLNNTQMRNYRAASQAFVNTDVVGGRRKSSSPFRLGGGYVAPHNIGISGHIGLWAAYDGVLTDTQILDLVSKAKSIMAGRGVTFSW